MAWRDEATFAAMELMHRASADAMRALEQGRDSVAVTDALTSADEAARAIVRPAMRLKVGVAADAWFSAQARTLRRIDVRLEALALGFAAISERPSMPQDEAVAEDWTVPAWLRGPVETIGSTVARAASEVASRAVPDMVRNGAEHASARIGRGISQLSGANERLRMAAQREFSCIWLGPSPDASGQQPYLLLLLDIVDRTAAKALETVA